MSAQIETAPRGTGAPAVLSSSEEDVVKACKAIVVLVVAGLIVLARPLTVIVCLGADRRGRWTREEIAFLGWTRETGVVAAALAGLMVAREIPDAELIVTTVAVAIVATLALQTTTKTWLGRRLGLGEG